MKKWILEGTAVAALEDGKNILKSIPRKDMSEGNAVFTSQYYKISDQTAAYIGKILNGRAEVYICVNIFDDGSVEFFEEVDMQGSKVADLPPEEGEVLDGV